MEHILSNFTSPDIFRDVSTLFPCKHKENLYEFHKVGSILSSAIGIAVLNNSIEGIDPRQMGMAFFVDYQQDTIGYVVIWDTKSHARSGWVFILLCEKDYQMPHKFMTKVKSKATLCPGWPFAGIMMIIGREKMLFENELKNDYIRIPWKRKRCDNCKKRCKKAKQLRLCKKCK